MLNIMLVIIYFFKNKSCFSCYCYYYISLLSLLSIDLSFCTFLLTIIIIHLFYYVCCKLHDLFSKVNEVSKVTCTEGYQSRG